MRSCWHGSEWIYPNVICSMLASKTWSRLRKKYPALNPCISMDYPCWKPIVWNLHQAACFAQLAVEGTSAGAVRWYFCRSCLVETSGDDVGGKESGGTRPITSTGWVSTASGASSPIFALPVEDLPAIFCVCSGMEKKDWETLSISTSVWANQSDAWEVDLISCIHFTSKIELNEPSKTSESIVSKLRHFVVNYGIWYKLSSKASILQIPLLSPFGWAPPS